MTLASTSVIFLENAKSIDNYVIINHALVREVLIERALERMSFMTEDESREEFENQISIYKNVYGDEGIEEMREVYERYEKAVYNK